MGRVTRSRHCTNVILRLEECQHELMNHQSLPSQEGIVNVAGRVGWKASKQVELNTTFKHYRLDSRVKCRTVQLACKEQKTDLSN